ncbi:MAG: HEPN domain-containing protein [Parcubacteria group bacterium]|nr:HEPN domain-containing protein [Parcubacteria group bacterium]
MKETKALIKYWQRTAEHDRETMVSLFKAKRYSDSLFYGHLMLEKILKALVIKETKNHSKPIHNLAVLAQDANLVLDKADLEFLAEANKFNIRARYPDYKLSFYKLCTWRYTEPKIKKINALYKQLCQKLPPLK